MSRRPRTKCTACGRKVYRDETVGYSGTPRGDEAFCSPCHRELLGLGACGHARNQARTRDDGTTYCRGCEVDHEAERRLEYDERRADRRSRQARRITSRQAVARRGVGTFP